MVWSKPRRSAAAGMTIMMIIGGAAIFAKAHLVNSSCPTIMMRVDVRRDFWYVERLLLIAAMKGSPDACVLARIPQGLLRYFVESVSDYICTPPIACAHPRALQACRACFTPVCEACYHQNLLCRCGCNDHRIFRGPAGKSLPCYFRDAGQCYSCAARVSPRHAACCFRCGEQFI